MRRTSTIRAGGVLLALLLAAAPAAAQTTVSAYADKTQMGDEETLLYTVEVVGDFGDLGPVRAPDTRNLTALQTTPVQAWEVTRVNGQQRQRLTLQWQYRPLRTGTAVIGPATIRLDGRDYTTDAVTVQVVAQAQRPAPPTWSATPYGRPRPEPRAEVPDLFLRPEATAETAYVGEQVVVDYVLYFAAGVHPRNSRLASAWDAEGFWREELNIDPYTGSRTVEMDGRMYEAVPIKRLALFPTRSGRLAVDSLQVEIDVLRARRSGGSQGRFYNPFASRFERETITAPPVEIHARPLPDGAPPSFHGAVGTFDLAVEADRATLDAGEPVRLTVTLSGAGNLATLEPPVWEAPPTFERYPPQVRERADRHARQLRGQKQWTYTLVPRSGGTFTLPPLAWSYFDPGSGTYRTLRSDSLAVTVVGPAAPRAETDAAAPRTLAGPMATATWQRPPRRTPLYTQPLVIGLFALPALALLALLAVRHRQRPDDTPRARRRRARSVAEHALREAEALRQRGEARAAHTATERALRQFLSDRLDVPAHGLALADLDRLLAERGVRPETRAGLLDLLRRCEQAQFAPTALLPRDEAAAHAARLVVAVDEEGAPLTTAPA